MAAPFPGHDGGTDAESVTVVTISSTYGAGGSVVAPRLAQLLGLPAADRAFLPAELRQLTEGPAEHEQEEGWLARLIAGASRMPALMGVSLPQPPEGVSEVERFRGRNEEVICQLVASGGVILGRGAAAFLGRDGPYFHIRLDGPEAARIAQGARIEHITEGEAARRRAVTDRARSLYVRRFYGCEVTDASLYHLAVDSTRVPLDAVAELGAAAVRAAARRQQP